jgi:hypothetical protein
MENETDMADTNTGASVLDGFVKRREFHSAGDFPAFLAAPDLRSLPLVFRGQADAGWPLRPSLERFAKTLKQPLGEIDSIEAHHLREFRRRAHHYSRTVPKHNNLLDWFALMRHHGSPTRLLDFSKSPYIAAFFATAEAERSNDVAVWAINADTIKRRSAEVLSEEMLSYYRPIGKNCLEDKTFSLADPKVFEILIGGIDFRSLKRTCGPIPSAVFPVEPDTMNERMLLQQGLFLFACSLRLGFEHSLKTVLERPAKDGEHDASPTVWKFVIKAQAHPNLLRELHRMGLNYATLSPGLDGLARSLSTVSQIRATCRPVGHSSDFHFDDWSGIG